MSMASNGVNGRSSAPAKPLRIAVTGGSGKIGRAVVRELVGRGHQVLNLDRRPSPDRLARFIYLDLRQREQVQPVLEQADAVIHLGEITHSNAPHSADDIFSHNTRVASVVMQTAADLRLQRAIYTSSAQVYGCWDRPEVPPLRLPFDETHPVQPQNVYALSKSANESFAALASKSSGLSVAIFRLPWVMNYEMDDDHWHWLERGAPMDGMATFLHMSDAARAYALAVENPLPGCEAYHFTADDVMLLRPLAPALKEARPHFPALPDDWPGIRSPILTDKAREHFGWRPQWSLREQYRKRFGKDPF